MKWIFTCAVTLFSALITGCDTDLLKLDESKAPEKIIEISNGLIQIGQTNRYEMVFTTVFNGRARERTSIDSTTFSSVNELPDEYGYQDPEGGPFLAITTTNSLTLGVFTQYLNAQGNFSLSVDSATYSSKEDTEHVSERDSLSLSYTIGKPYKVTDNQKRYSIYDHNEVSNAQGFSVYTPRSIEVVETESGNFNTLKIDYRNERKTEFSNGESELRKANGSQWLDIASGKLIKNTASGTSKRSEYNEIIQFKYTQTYIDEILPAKTIESVDDHNLNTELKIRKKILLPI